MGYNIDRLLEIAKPPKQQVLDEARYRKEHKEELRAKAKQELQRRREARLKK